MGLNYLTPTILRNGNGYLPFLTIEGERNCPQ